MDMEKVNAFMERSRRMRMNDNFEVPEYADAYWNDLSDFIVSDLAGAIEFLCNDDSCTADVFVEWSSVFDDVARKSQSREFVEALKVAARRFPKACEEYSIVKCIEFAEDELLD